MRGAEPPVQLTGVFQAKPLPSNAHSLDKGYFFPEVTTLRHSNLQNKPIISGRQNEKFSALAELQKGSACSGPGAAACSIKAGATGRPRSRQVPAK